MQYQILAGTTAKKLEKMVALFIEAGWKPIGGLAVDSNSGTPYFYQAVTKGDK